MLCRRCHDERWVCEQHPAVPWPHDDCTGPGIPCPVCNNADGRPELPASWESIARVEYDE